MILLWEGYYSGAILKLSNDPPPPKRIHTILVFVWCLQTPISSITIKWLQYCSSSSKAKFLGTNVTAHHVDDKHNRYHLSSTCCMSNNTRSLNTRFFFVLFCFVFLPRYHLNSHLWFLHLETGDRKSVYLICKVAFRMK